MPDNVGFTNDSSGAYGVMGYINGVAAQVKTPYYISSVLKYTHGRLSGYFDEWMDATARAAPDDYMHVYEWPSGWGADDKPDYGETVGNPEARLWAHTLQGASSKAQASFVFLPSERPSPVDPILQSHGVKTGVHKFVYKAKAFEYAMPITVTPKMADYLAYVVREKSSGGSDAGLAFVKGNREEGPGVAFSKGPVNFVAGGGHNAGKFTTAFRFWYGQMAQDHLANEILPQFEQDLARTVEMQMATAGKSSVKIGAQNRTKSLGISGWASQNNARFAEAKRKAQADLKKVADVYASKTLTTAGREALTNEL